MKTIIRRLRRLEEERFGVFRVRQADENPAELLRERRRRRAEASGEPFEEWPRERERRDQIWPLSVAGILRSRRAAQAKECVPVSLTVANYEEGRDEYSTEEAN